MLIGIVIGVATEIIVVAIGTAGQRKIEKELETFGINSIWVWRDPEERKQAKENIFTSNNEISINDVQNIETYFSDISFTTPCLYFRANVTRNDKNQDIGIIGTVENFQYSNNETMSSGRFLCTQDIREQRKVCVLSSEIKEIFFNNENPIGKRLHIKNEIFTVVGVFNKKETPFLEAIRSVKQGREKGVYVPISILQMWHKTNNVSFLQANVMPQKTEEVIKRLCEFLAAHHGGRTKYKTESMQTYIRISNKIMGTLKVVFAIIATISLFVGGLGIMNIMLISVTERTKEIGLRKAVGANEMDIIFQFLIEAVTVSILGGTMGILVGLIGTNVVGQLANVGNTASLQNIAIAFCSSAFVGILAGIYPAIHAARLDPITSLKYE